MAKKRKVHPTTEPESAIVQEPEQPPQQEEPQFEAEPEQQEQIEEEEEEEPQDMEEENENEDGDEEGAEDEDEDEDDKSEPQEGDETVEASAEANGGDNKTAENGGVDEGELEEESVEKVLEPFVKEQLVILVKEAVTKYPELMENVLKLADADPAHRKIFVHGLGWDTNTETLTGIFGKYGEIEDCKAVFDKATGKCKGYGFVLYKHRLGARKALKEPQKKIGTRLASCQLASAGPVPAQGAPVAAPTAPAAPPVSEYTQRKIFVSNVSADIDTQKLLEFFSKYGEIEDGPLGLDKQTGKPRGFCLFVYKSVESAKKALEEPHKNFEGVTLNCQKAVDGPKQNKPFFQQPHHQQQYPSHSNRKDKNKYGGGGGSASGHMMAPAGSGMGFNPAVAAPGLTPALGQALTALLGAQGAGLGITNLLGGFGGAPVNQGGPPVMNNQGYGNQPGVGYGNQQPGVGYGNQQGMQGGYQNPQMGYGTGRQPGGAPYMGHGH